MKALAFAVVLAACHEPEAAVAPPVTSRVAPPSSEAPASPADPPAQVSFVSAGDVVDGGACMRVAIAVAEGSLLVDDGELTNGDVAIFTHSPPMKIGGAGLGIAVRYAVGGRCVVKAALATERNVVRGAPALRLANGQTEVHLDLRDARLSPELYLGRLSSKIPVLPHKHATEWEILVTVRADGRATRGRETFRVGPRQIVVIPPNTEHSWTPEPGSELVALQIYTPSGPEQRFLRRAETDASGH